MVKNLFIYLSLKNQIFAFSSDIIAFSDIKEFSLSLDLQGLACFFNADI